MKGVIYTRVSSDEQVDGTSLASQEEFCRIYCAQKQIEVVGVFKEEGETAKDLSLNNRTRFLAALEFCRANKPAVGAFIVLRVDRFARNTEDHFAIRRILQDYGTALHSVTEPIGNRPAEKFIETVLAGAAEYDNALRRQRCTDGMRARLAQGIWPWKPPIGYACSRHRAKDEKKTQPDKPDPVLFPLIQKALRSYARGEIESQTELARQLNVWGFLRITGKQATKQLVDRVLGPYLPFYAGMLRNPFDGMEIPGAQIHMISMDELAQIRARRAGRRQCSRSGCVKRHPSFPLRHLLRCSRCGKRLTGAVSSGRSRKYAYYFCHRPRCDSHFASFRAERVHASVSALLDAMATQIGAPDEVESLVRAYWDAIRATRQPADDAGDRELSALKARRQRLFDMREDGVYDSKTLRERLEVVDVALAALQSQTPKRSIADLDIDELTAAFHWYIAQLNDLWSQLRIGGNPSRFENFTFPEGIVCVNATDVRTATLPPIFALFSTSSDLDDKYVDPGGLSSNNTYESFRELLTLYRDSNDADGLARSANKTNRTA